MDVNNLRSSIEQAIQIEWNPLSPPAAKASAVEFISRARSDPACWHACFQIFTEPAPTVTTPAHGALRHFSIETINNAIRSPGTDPDAVAQFRAGILEYVSQKYAPSAAAAGIQPDSAYIQNKLAETFTALLVSSYLSSFPDFFRYFQTLILGSDGALNQAGAQLFLRVLITIHDEIADTLLVRSPGLSTLHTKIKDRIRENEIPFVAHLWTTLLSRWEHLDVEQTNNCLKSIGRWVQWCDLSSVVQNEEIMKALCTIVNPNFLPPGPFELTSAVSGRTRLMYTAVDTFTGIVSKKTTPEKRVSLIRALDLSSLVSLLIQSRQLSEFQNTEHYDNDLAESVAKLIDQVILGLLLIVDSKSSAAVPQDVLEAAQTTISEFVPYLLRFLSDQYDSVCHAVINSTTALLAWYKKVAERNSAAAVKSELTAIFKALVMKIRFDNSIDDDDELEETEEVFIDLRRKLAALQKVIADIDRQLYVEGIITIIDENFGHFQTDREQLSWRDMELALFELMHLSEVFQRVTATKPTGELQHQYAEQVIARVEAMAKLPIFKYPNVACQLLYMDICIKFLAVFEVKTDLVMHALTSYTQLAQATNVKVRHRAWHSLAKFVGARNLREVIAPIASALMGSIEDLLTIRQTWTEIAAHDLASGEDRLMDDEFKAQLSLFETVGSLIVSLRGSESVFMSTTQSVLSVLCEGIRSNLEGAKKKELSDETLLVHHNIMAIGTIAYKLGPIQDHYYDDVMASTFEQANNAVLTALVTLRFHKPIRIACRFAVTRIVDVMRRRITPHFYHWFTNLFSPEMSNVELTQLLPLLNQIVYTLQRDIEPVIGEKLPEIVALIIERLKDTTVGTDAEVERRDLQKEFLSFVLYLVSNEMGAVFTMEENQQTFQTTVLFIRDIAKNGGKSGNVSLAMKTLNKMLQVFSGPGDIVPDKFISQLGLSQASLAEEIERRKFNGGGVEAVSPFELPQFISLVFDILLPLVWLPLSSRELNPKDGDGKEVIKECVHLQVILTQKAGAAFLERMKQDLSQVPVFGPENVNEYLTVLYETAVHRLVNAQATNDDFLSGGHSAVCAIPFPADPKVKELRTYYEGVIRHVQSQQQ